ncbi:MAG: hypothetical protein C5B50_25965 [Verrucomicrobia bacterium]|nr:MAG: hypothetical protein C5B50_25965 [Verrucomicrobiota bacterium]
MNSKTILAFINLIAALVFLSRANGAEPASSPEQLRSRVEMAFKTKDTNAFAALFNSNGMSDETKTQIPMMASMIFKSKVTNVVVQPVPANFQNAFIRNGITYTFNLPVTGVIALQYGAAQLQTSVVGGGQVTLPYGKGPDGYYLVLQGKKTSDQSNPSHPDKMINILVTASGWKTPPLLSVDYAYFGGANEIKSHSVHQGIISENFWGRSVEYCNVKTTGASGTTRLRIKANGVDVFDSGEVDVEKTKEIHFDANQSKSH